MSRSSSHVLAVAVIALVLFAGGGRARAEVPTASADVRRAAAAHFTAAVKLAEGSDWRGAMLEFERAYALAPNYRVLYNIAECRYRLGDYAGALSQLDAFVDQADTRLSPARRSAVEAAAGALRRRVARLRVTSEPAGVEIRVDDAVVGTTPLPRALFVNSGFRKIAASKPGYVGFSQYLDVSGEGVTEVAFALSSRPEPPPPAIVTVVPPPPARSIVPAVAFFGVGAAAFALGTAFGVDAIAEKSQLDRQCGGGTCPASSRPLIDEARRNAVFSTVGLGIGVASVGAGIAYVLLGSGAGSASRSGATIRPVLGLGGLGAAGTF